MLQAKPVLCKNPSHYCNSEVILEHLIPKDFVGGVPPDSPCGLVSPPNLKSLPLPMNHAQGTTPMVEQICLVSLSSYYSSGHTKHCFLLFIAIDTRNSIQQHSMHNHSAFCLNVLYAHLFCIVFGTLLFAITMSEACHVCKQQQPCPSLGPRPPLF